MFRWEPEGQYRCTMSMTIAPFWFPTEHLWIVIAPFWLSTNDVYYKHTSCMTTFCVYNKPKHLTNQHPVANSENFWNKMLVPSYTVYMCIHCSVCVVNPDFPITQYLCTMIQVVYGMWKNVQGWQGYLSYWTYKLCIDYSFCNKFIQGSRLCSHALLVS